MDLRRRKQVGQVESSLQHAVSSTTENNTPAKNDQLSFVEKCKEPGYWASAAASGALRLGKVLWFLLGVIACILTGVANAKLQWQTNENKYWFSNIKEVEREISFRTESGLYYSYYKQIVNAPSFNQAIKDLQMDNITEYGRTINILARFNIYQEVLLGALYRGVPALRAFYPGSPAFFYMSAVFNLHGVLVLSLCVIAWLLSGVAGKRMGVWMCGPLAGALYMFNRSDTTRVPYTVPLRESFALPFLWTQVALVTYLLKPGHSYASEAVLKMAIFIVTFLFAICWQFNQFLLLLQVGSLFAGWCLNLVSQYKVVSVLVCDLLALVAVGVAQFSNPMIWTSLTISFIMASLITMYLWDGRGTTGGVVRGILCILLKCITVLIIAVSLNFTTKTLVQHQSDEHIFKFIMAKFNISQTSDFDAMLYLCNGGFGFLDSAFFTRMGAHWAFQPYVFYHTVSLIAVIVGAFQAMRNTPGPCDSHVCKKKKKSCGCLRVTYCLSHRPELVFNVVQCGFFAVLALFVLRMKFLWSVYICIFAACSLCDPDLWAVLSRIIPSLSQTKAELGRHLIVVMVMGAILYQSLPPLLNELKVEDEFYDPDTVDLMEWISSNTAPKAVFTGSMQLLAGVKLCTGRPITNHPHYEDQHLRHRTYELYHIYAREPPSLVRDILKRYGTNYIILEDSICIIPPNGCRLPDVLDITKGIIPRDNVRPDIAGLKESDVPRFCDEVRYGRPEYSAFKLVYSNKTFRVYQLVS